MALTKRKVRVRSTNLRVNRWYIETMYQNWQPVASYHNLIIPVLVLA